MRPQRWYEGIEQCQQCNEAYVLVTVVGAAGSTPRETGSKMVVTAGDCIDTIGGGHLEFDAIKRARALLAEGKPCTSLHSYPLSSSLGQCCGGAMKVLFDVCNVHQQHIAIFGAGHVAKALVPILAQLPLRISWIDNREAIFPENIPSNVTVVAEDEPESEVAHLDDNSWLIILTHDHQLDYRIAEKALSYPSLPFVGLIGSQTKAKRFVTKLQQRGFDTEALSRLHSPIGDTNIPGKRPIEVAVSISAQIITQLHASVNELVEEAVGNTVERKVESTAENHRVITNVTNQLPADANKDESVDTK
jgi:xanthine dehydrogenase accessory factor